MIHAKLHTISTIRSQSRHSHHIQVYFCVRFACLAKYSFRIQMRILRYRNWFDDFSHRQRSTDFNTCCQCQHSLFATQNTIPPFAEYIFILRIGKRMKPQQKFAFLRFPIRNSQSRLTTHFLINYRAVISFLISTLTHSPHTAYI